MVQLIFAYVKILRFCNFGNFCDFIFAIMLAPDKHANSEQSHFAIIFCDHKLSHKITHKHLLNYGMSFRSKPGGLCRVLPRPFWHGAVPQWSGTQLHGFVAYTCIVQTRKCGLS